MSKRILCIILGMITVFLLPACYASKTSTTSSNTASSTSQSSSTSTSSTSQKGILPILMDIDALMQEITTVFLVLGRMPKEIP